MIFRFVAAKMAEHSIKTTCRCCQQLGACPRMASASCVADPLAVRSSSQFARIRPASGQMGWPNRRNAVVTASLGRSAPVTLFIMADRRHNIAPAQPPGEGAVLLTQVDFDVENSAGDGGAGLGSTVRVADERGRTTEYDLIGRRSHTSERREVTLASPVGKGLWGARPGDVVQVRLPNGRSRTLRVLDVRHGKPVAGTEKRVMRAA